MLETVLVILLASVGVGVVIAISVKKDRLLLGVVSGVVFFAIWAAIILPTLK